jgi:hypothetical protein
MLVHSLVTYDLPWHHILPTLSNITVSNFWAGESLCYVFPSRIPFAHRHMTCTRRCRWSLAQLNVVFPSHIRDCLIMSWGHATKTRPCGRSLASKSFGFRGKNQPVTCRGGVVWLPAPTMQREYSTCWGQAMAVAHAHMLFWSDIPNLTVHRR